jgi:hypothetical protein
MHGNRCIRPALEVLEDRSLLSSDIRLLDVTTFDFTEFDIRYAIAGADAPAFALQAYLSADETLDAQDQLVPGRLQVSRAEDLIAGLAHQTTFDLSARAPVHEGQRFVLVVADPDFAVEGAGTASRADNALFAAPLFATGQTADRDGNASPGEAIPSAAGQFTGAILRGTADFARLSAVDLAATWRPSPRFQFGFTEGETEPWQRDEDRFAQQSVIQPLTQLVHLLSADLARAPDLWGDATFSINEAYDSLRHHSIPESLHYEGRALDLDVLGRPARGPELARLAGLSWLAGFDWVLLEDTHVHVSEHAAFATTISQQSLQQSVTSAFQLRRINSALVTFVLVRTLDGLDQALQQGRVLQALAQLYLFRTEVLLATGRSVRDTGFAQLLVLNVDKLIGRLQGSLLPSAANSATQPWSDPGAECDLADWDALAAQGRLSWWKRDIVKVFA